MSRTLQILAIVVSVIALALFLWVISRALFVPAIDQSITPPQVAAPIGPIEKPVRLSIPTLGVEAKVQAVGIAKSGNMAVPSNYTDVGWYRQGTVPGQRGSAVIDGHVDNGLALPAVFYKVETLRAGDDIYVATENGNRLHFVVEEVAVYPYTDVPLETLFTRNDQARLNLITCTGSWISTKKTYDHRVVVYAVLAQ